MDPYVGEIRMFGFTFAPIGWALCNGAILSIQQNTALFSLLGVQFGGDGRMTFALPNLQGSVPLGIGQGAGLSSYGMGQIGGASAVTLLATQMPAHTHALPENGAGTGLKVNTPAPGVFLGGGGRSGGVTGYVAPADLGSPVQMNASAVGPVGGSTPHNNMSPYLAMNYCIALTGVFPPRS